MHRLLQAAADFPWLPCNMSIAVVISSFCGKHYNFSFYLFIYVTILSNSTSLWRDWSSKGPVRTKINVIFNDAINIKDALLRPQIIARN